MSRTKRLIAVPPLSAKQSSSATRGKVLISSATWLRWVLLNAIEILRHSDLIGGVELAALNQHPFALAQIDRILVDPLCPRVLMTVSEKEEEPLHLQDR